LLVLDHQPPDLVHRVLRDGFIVHRTHFKRHFAFTESLHACQDRRL
jgi:hypothetical protein